MTTKTYEYNPDYAVPPGWVLEDRLDAQNISHAEFARRCGRSPKLISEIIAGKAPVEPKTAIQFERVLGVDAEIWLGIETDYRLHLEREAEAIRANELIAWAKTFPVNELVKRNIFAKPNNDADRVKSLLSFFGVASKEAWEGRQKSISVAYRHSPSFKSNESALATWLRLGELDAAQVECPDYNVRSFRQALSHIRGMTADPGDSSIEDAQRLCQESGVVLAIIKPLPKTALSGATRWITPRKALIQLSARHMRDDQLWFSFFHEAAHILLHSKRDVFVHENGVRTTDADVEADKWAADFLIAQSDWDRFKKDSIFDREGILEFANQQGIAPGIVVGRLQHEGSVSWSSNLNKLRIALKWSSDAA